MNYKRPKIRTRIIITLSLYPIVLSIDFLFSVKLRLSQIGLNAKIRNVREKILSVVYANEAVCRETFV